VDRSHQREVLDEYLRRYIDQHEVTVAKIPVEVESSVKPDIAPRMDQQTHESIPERAKEAVYNEDSWRTHMEGLDGIYVHTIQAAVNEAEKVTLQRLTSTLLTPVGTTSGNFGTVCKDWTRMLDVVAKQEVTNETLSYIPMKVSAVCEDDVVLGYIAMVERQMERERLPLAERPSITVTQEKVGTRDDVSLYGYVDPGAAHSVIRRDVVDKAGIRIYTDPRAAKMQGFGNASDKPAGFCFLVNEVTGRDTHGNEQIVRFITMPLVVEETTVKFPYLLGAEITNRIICITWMNETCA